MLKIYKEVLAFNVSVRLQSDTQIIAKESVFWVMLAASPRQAEFMKIWYASDVVFIDLIRSMSTTTDF